MIFALAHFAFLNEQQGEAPQRIIIPFDTGTRNSYYVVFKFEFL